MLISLTLAPLVKTQLKSEFLPILLRVNAYQFCIPFCFSTEQNRTNRVDWVRLGSVIELNRTHKKVPVRLCSIAEPIELQSNDWVRLVFGSVSFDWLRRVRIKEKVVTKTYCGRCSFWTSSGTESWLNTPRPCYFFASRNHSLVKLINWIKRKLKKHATQGTVCMFKWTFDLTLQRGT